MDRCIPTAIGTNQYQYPAQAIQGRQSLRKPNAKEVEQSAKWTDCNYYGYCQSHYCKWEGNVHELS